jgi:allantoate deiminase
MSKTEAAIGATTRSRLGDEIVSRINQLGAISETPAHLARSSFRLNIASRLIS